MSVILRNMPPRLPMGVLCSILAVSTPLVAQDPISKSPKPLESAEQERERRAENWSRWNENRQEQNQKQRVGASPPAAGSPSTASRLEHSDLPAGRYRVSVGAGVDPVDIDVVPAKRPANAEFWSESRVAELYELSRKLETQLRDLRLALYAKQLLVAFQPTVRHTEESLTRLTSSLLVGAPPADVRRQYRAFDENWRGLHAILAKETGGDIGLTRLRVEADHVARRLDLSVRVTGPLYDRLTVTALARQLVVVTDRLAEQFALEGVRPLVALLRPVAERVERKALTFATAVETDAPFYEVIAHYQAFDEEWNTLVARANPNPEVGPQLRLAGQAVWQIEQRLHETLLLAPPVWSESERYAARVGLLRREAAALAVEVKTAATSSPRAGIPTDEAESFWWQVRELEKAVTEGEATDVIQTRWKNVQSEWSTFRKKLDLVPRTATSSDLLVKEIETQLTALGQERS